MSKTQNQKNNSKNNKLISLEERVLSIIEYSSNHNSHTKPFNRKKKKIEDYTTIKDSLYLLNPIQENDSLRSTQSQYQKDNKNEINNINKSINIKKELLKGAERKFTLNLSPIIQPKFKNLELSKTINSLLKHDITPSITDFLETDEKIPINKLEQIEKRKNIIVIDKNFSYKLLKEEEKCYEEIIKDFKGNGFGNIKYKQKLSASYLTILLNENYTIGTIFLNFKDINQFIIRELCVFLCILFLDEFKDLSESELTDFKNCLTYCHFNFLYVLMLIVKNTKENELNSNIDKLNYNAFQNCKNILYAVEDKIDYDKYKNNFNNQNKVIKHLLLNLLNNLSYLNENISNEIQQIFNSSKTSTLNEIILNKIQYNDTIINKINKIAETENEKNQYNINKKSEKKLETKKEENKESTNDNNEEEEESEEEILIQPDPPFLPKKDKNDKREYTLVLDLDETLVHYFEDNDEENAYVKVRLGAEKFIKVLSQYCEIVIFTASTQEYANIVIDGLDCSDKISFRLYRQHTNIINGYNVKDLSKLGRDISKMIIVDNIEENYYLQPENGLNISDFEGDENDNELIFLMNDLVDIVKNNGVDVRKMLPDVRKKMQRRYTNIS